MSPGERSVIPRILQDICKTPDLSIMELGTRRWGDKPTHHKHLFNSPKSYTMVDAMDGLDVDVVCDAHKLTSKFGVNSYDVFFSASTWEHLHSPWIAAREVHSILRPGGYFFIQTHFIFNLHGYPNDYFRFTADGLKSLFSWGTELNSWYEFPCKVIPPVEVTVWNEAAPAYLNVCIEGRK